MTQTLTPAQTAALDAWWCWLPSYCLDCQMLGCSSTDSVTDPCSYSWPGGTALVTALYECPCGHRWTDTWRRQWLFGPDPDPGELTV